MIFIIKDDLIRSLNKILITRNLFDFIKNRVNMYLCVIKKFVLNPFSEIVYF